MEHGRSYHYSGEGANFYDFVIDALTAFWHIKRETRERGVSSGWMDPS
jgi:hypothetical protein